MKNFKIFLILLVAGLLCNDLKAVPVYASQWSCGDQTVTLYGDLHRENHEANEPLAHAFIENLMASERETLVLVESPEARAHQLMQLCNIDYESLEINLSEQFLGLIWPMLNSPTISTDRVTVKNIDERIEDAFLEHNSMRSLIAENLASQKIQTFFENMSPHVPESPDKCFEWTINKIRALIEETTGPDNETINNILENIIQTLQHRQRLFARYLRHINVLDRELRLNHSNPAISDACQFLALSSAELIDATALWHIAGTQQPHQNIVVVAGLLHINEIENYLKQLDYTLTKFCSRPNLQATISTDYKFPDPDQPFPITYAELQACGFPAISLDRAVNFSHLPPMILPSNLTLISPEVFTWLRGTSTTNPEKESGARRQREEV